MQILLVLAGIAVFISGLVYRSKEREAVRKKLLLMTPEEQEAYHERERVIAENKTNASLHGDRNELIQCPHCRGVGAVRTKPVKLKKGISGGKATAALLTAGTSMLVTGLSRKQAQTEASCGRCKSLWHH